MGNFESQLMRSNANEHEYLGERIRRSSKDVAALRSGSTKQEESVRERASQKRGISSSSTKVSRGNSRTAERLGIAERGESSSPPEGRNSVREEQNPYSYNIGVAGYYKRLGQLWTQKRCRRALLSASVAMISQQMTGVNTIALLGTTVWETTLGKNINAKVVAMIGLVFGGTGCLVGLLAYWLSDICGRSILLAAGLPNMAWSLFVLAFLFRLPDSSAARTPLISTFTIIFQIFYAATAGTSPFSISAEVFPLVSREVGMAVSVAINLLGAGVLVLLFPLLLNTIGVTASLSIFAALNLVAFVLVWLLCPETKRRTLEELQYTFDLSTWWHIEYRAVYVRRHFCKNVWRYLTGESLLPSTPFYRWARIKYGERLREQ
ncbi:hypothetical protein SLS62_002609 [Diatrype stigma]|uniref:Major facilitator superfamily (MFS) profile domain-containing protein n=1 Tax=Diatrype stigma TaxID=117547 RepID=A0AAN9UXZ3_9PEZI